MAYFTNNITEEKKEFKVVKARLLALSARGASHWLSDLPEPKLGQLSMSNVKFSFTLRFRLGLPLILLNFKKCACKKIGITIEHICSCPTFSKTHRHMGPLLTLRQICNSAGLPNTYETPVDADVIDVERKGSEHVMHAITAMLMGEEENIHKDNVDVMVLHPFAKAYLDPAGRDKKNSTSAFKSLAAADAGVLIKKKRYCNWSARQRLNRSGHELVPFVLETFGGIHKFAVDLLRKISNYVAQYDAPLSAIILSNYIKMISTSVQIGVIDMVFKACHDYKVMHYGKA